MTRKDDELVHLSLSKQVRAAVLAVYLERNPYHDHPDWPAELRDFSLNTYAAVADRLLAAGWKPPEGHRSDTVEGGGGI